MTSGTATRSYFAPHPPELHPGMLLFARNWSIPPIRRRKPGPW